MLALLLAALAVAPWSQPLRFAPLAGWQTGGSGNTPSAYGGRLSGRPVESAAWIARGVRYRDRPTADPPNRTLRRFPRRAVIVWAVIYESAAAGQAPIRLRLAAAKRFACCEAEPVLGGMRELSGAGPGHAYSVIVRIYFGARPTVAARAEAQRALDRLELPSPR